MESYSFAARLFGLQSEMEGTMIEDDYRFYPMATTYFELDHVGGDCTFAHVGDDEDVQFSLHPVVSGDKVGPAIKEWRIGDEPIWTEAPSAGDYWVIGSLPILTDNPQKIEFCLGSDCVVPELDDVEDDRTDAQEWLSIPTVVHGALDAVLYRWTENQKRVDSVILLSSVLFGFGCAEKRIMPSKPTSEMLYHFDLEYTLDFAQPGIPDTESMWKLDVRLTLDELHRDDSLSLDWTFWMFNTPMRIQNGCVIH